MRQGNNLFLFSVFLLIGILGTVFYGYITKYQPRSLQTIIQTVKESGFAIEKPPSQSLKGIILAMTGEIGWQSRVATEAATIINPAPLQQGEVIRTGETGELTLEFKNVAGIDVLPETQLEFSQTLPVNFVVWQASGSAEFKKLGNVPVSVRAEHLLIKQNDGNMSIGVDSANLLVNINIISGSISVAYNDLNNVSHIVNAASGKRITFNDAKRVVEE